MEREIMREKGREARKNKDRTCEGVLEEKRKGDKKREKKGCRRV